MIIYFKNLNFFNKIIWILFFISFFLFLYVHATTNRLYLYILEYDIKGIFIPFYIVLISIILLSVFFILYNTIKTKKIKSSIKIIGLSISIISVLVELFDFAPCLFEHNNSLTNHEQPYTLNYILMQSFLCPSFSIPSRIMLLFFFITGLCIFFFIKVIEE